MIQEMNAAEFESVHSGRKAIDITTVIGMHVPRGKMHATNGKKTFGGPVDAGPLFEINHAITTGLLNTK